MEGPKKFIIFLETQAERGDASKVREGEGTPEDDECSERRKEISLRIKDNECRSASKKLLSADQIV